MLYNGRATDSVRTRPMCDVPECEDLAAVDAASVQGSWGYFCTRHHSSYCHGRLGIGEGQVLLCNQDDGTEDEMNTELKEHYDLEEMQ